MPPQVKKAQDTRSTHQTLAAIAAVSSSQRQNHGVVSSSRSEAALNPNSDKKLFFEEGVLTILVGPNERPFYIHRKLLLDKVPYFNICLKQPWKKKGEPVKLVDIDMETFRFVASWLYSGSLPDQIQKNGQGDLDWRKLDQVYKVADRLMMSRLQNDLIDVVLATMRLGARFWHVKKLERLRYLELSHLPYYQLVLRSLVHSLMTTNKVQLKEQQGPMWQDIQTAVMLYVRKPWACPTKTDRCDFHIHEGEDRCPKVPEPT